MRQPYEKSAVIALLAMSVLFVDGCCRRDSVAPGSSQQPGMSSSSSSDPSAKKQVDGQKSVVERPVELLEKTGLNYSIDGSKVAGKAAAATAGGFFEKQYLQGVELMEKGDYSKAIELFDELIKRYPNTEEASIAELCIAELYFRNKSNDRALQAYERIVANYPQSHAAENARAGIEYLKNFEKYEQEYVSPDVEARKRRGY